MRIAPWLEWLGVLISPSISKVNGKSWLWIKFSQLQDVSGRRISICKHGATGTRLRPHRCLTLPVLVSRRSSVGRCTRSGFQIGVTVPVGGVILKLLTDPRSVWVSVCVCARVSVCTKHLATPDVMQLTWIDDLAWSCLSFLLCSQSDRTNPFYLVVDFLRSVREQE